MEFLEIIKSQFSEQWVYLLRIVAAGICGALIGFERSRRLKEAGLRTHIIVAMGAALIMIVSKYGFNDIIDYVTKNPALAEVIKYDASRVASNIVTGVSFLGAGVIFVRSGSIKGLTTAAGLWTTAGVGMSIGAGLYFLGVATAIILIIVQILLHKFIPSTELMTSYNVSVTIMDKEGVIASLKKTFLSNGLYLQSFSAKYHDDGTVTIVAEIRTPKQLSIDDVLNSIAAETDLKEYSYSN